MVVTGAVLDAVRDRVAEVAEDAGTRRVATGG
jgi:hypothetical protein